MNKNFDIENSKNDIKGWDIVTNPYTTKGIENIHDTNPYDLNSEITSIPSPFLRIDLMMTALEEVNKMGVDGNSKYHKLVSYCLDIGQIFFNYSSYKNDIEIIPWDPILDLNKLIGGTQAQKRLGDTLKLYFEQDAQKYNFNECKKIYILKYKYNGEIIGATSPATLFFVSANQIDIRFQLGNHKPLSNDPNDLLPLYKRDKEYQRFLYSLRKSYNDFTYKFNLFDDYLNNNLAKIQGIDSEFCNELNQITNADYNGDNYSDIIENGITVEIINGIHVRTRQVAVRYDFQIDTNKVVGDIPLVLPCNECTGATNLYYTNSSRWDRSAIAKKIIEKPLNQRILPAVNVQYPYLSEGDFLEDTIIKVNQKLINQFFNGKYNSDEDYYLLPIKDMYFNYLGVDDLRKNIEIKQIETKVRVSLKIPIIGNATSDFKYILYEKEYDENNIKTLDFSIAVVSPIKDCNKTIELNDVDDKNIKLIFKKDENEIKCNSSYIRSGNTIATGIITNYDMKEEFNIIEIRSTQDHNIYKGLLIPDFIKRSTGVDFYFSIDLGTTNTHIEYSTSINPTLSQSFDITKNDQQIWIQASDTSATYRNIMEEVLLPEAIGGEAIDCSFPTRTAISYGKNVVWTTALYPFVHSNIPFYYAKRSINDFDLCKTDLKWLSDSEGQTQIDLFIQNLFVIIRNKVLLNNGNLANTKIVWHYPISMSTNRLNNFSQKWQGNYQKYFGGHSSNITAKTECQSPFDFFKSNNANINDIVTIDIGGGTTDVVISKDGKIEYITSFRFAVNSIFSNPVVGVAKISPIIQMFYGNILGVLEGNSMDDTIKAIKQIYNQGSSIELATFLISLKNNPDVIKKDIIDHVDFINQLNNNDNIKIVFIIFYSAIIYHIAKIMKTKEMLLPRNIAFSGNGSKILNVITSSDETLRDYTKKIFEKVYGNNNWNKANLALYRLENPKEATCKGGLLSISGNSPIAIMNQNNIKAKKVIYINDEIDGASIRYSDINGTIKDQMKIDVEDFINIIFEINNGFSFTDEFGISPNVINNIKGIIQENIDVAITKGINYKINELTQFGGTADNNIEETLFFYPIITMIGNISDYIYTTINNNNINTTKNN
jgi:hypothetical protein